MSVSGHKKNVGRVCVFHVAQALCQLHTSDVYHRCSGETSTEVICKMSQILNSSKQTKKHKPYS